ncbi:MAG TPA: alpha/beta hydrolase [Verrucomicrobiae bacterium]|nr:alpha/beta hydrolase [Verrucomicrobiae bacterium]
MATKRNSPPPKTKSKKAGKPRHGHKRLKRLAIALVVLVIAGWLSFRVSPWPGSLFIRYAFDKGGRKTAQKLEKYVPDGVSSVTNLQYRPGDKDAYLDAYYPSNTASNQRLPTIVWVHGGAWVSGSKETVANYVKILASHGYTVVAIDYSIAPEKHYPLPVVQTDAALRYVQANAARLHIDPSRFILAGDSAGSQIAAQVATIITNPAYARQMGMASPMASQQLKGMLLNCGAYDIALTQKTKAARDFVHTVLWAYSGHKDYVHDAELQYASVADYVTKDFPPSFITAGNADPLEPQSRELASRLSAVGVPLSTLFYPADHEPQLPHEYQFDLDQADGRNALNQMVGFLGQYTKP